MRQVNMTHEEREERRQRIAKWVENHPRWFLDRVARKYDVSFGTVRRACKERGIAPPREGDNSRPLKGSAVHILALHHGQKMSQSKIVEKLKVSRQRVSQIICEYRRLAGLSK